MNLSVRDAARLLQVSEKTIYRWIKSQAIPVYRMQDQYRFSRGEILEWATSRRLNVSTEILAEPEAADQRAPSLSEALEAGGVFYRVSGNDKESVLREVVQLLRLPEAVDRAFLLKVLLAREAMAPTAFGDGLAIPHARNPVVLHIERPTLSVSFLDQPIEYGALDGQPVDTLLTIISPSTRSHLNLLYRLSFVLRDVEVRQALREQATRQEIVRRIQNAEAKLNGTMTPSPPTPGRRKASNVLRGLLIPLGPMLQALGERILLSEVLIWV